MSEDRRYRKWKKKTREFYTHRDQAARKRTNIDINAAIEFSRSCKHGEGFVANPKFSKIDLESTFAGITIKNLTKIKENWEWKNIRGELIQNGDWWNLNFGQRVFRVDTQNLYRFTLLMKQIGKLNTQLIDQIPSIILQCYNKRKKVFHRVPNDFCSLRHLYEASISLVTCGVSIPPEVLEFIHLCRHKSGGYSNLPSRNPDLQSTYNALSIILLVEGELQDDKNTISEYIIGTWAQDGFRGKKNHHPNVWDNYCAILSLKMLSSNIEKYEPSLESYLASCQTKNGGMRSSIHEGQGTILRTYAAISILANFSNYEELLNKINPISGIP